MDWDRVWLKEAGKDRFRENYGSCVLVSLIMILLTGNGVPAAIERRIEDITFAVWFIVPGLVFIAVKVFVFRSWKQGHPDFMWKTEITRRECLSSFLAFNAATTGM